MLFPHMYSFARQKDITVASVLALDELQGLFHLLLSEEAYEQFYKLHVVLQSLPTNGIKIYGHTYGKMESTLQGKSTNIYLVPREFTVLLAGYRNLSAK
jgi:hypothetical protein